jgi:GTPase
MLPVVVIVGRPNVGKSTLFNQLTRTRDALVADTPGLTRDRHYGYGVLGPRPYIVVDTGGLDTTSDGVEVAMAEQTRLAIREADALILLVDGRDGRAPGDEMLTDELRRVGVPVHLVVNKTEGLAAAEAAIEFHELGLGDPLCISAAHGQRLGALMEHVLEPFPEADADGDERTDDGAVRVAIVGRPNVGKSTLINRLVGEQRVVAFDQPGTTRDSIDVPFELDGRPYCLVDTAGLRRRARVHEVVEKFSVIKALQAIDKANAVIYLIDASEGVTDQDQHLLGLVTERGRALVVALNKWDGLDADHRSRVREQADRKLGFADYAERRTISALHGSGVGNLMEAVDVAFESATRDLPTAELTRILEVAVQEHSPPLVRGRRIKLRYAHQGGRNPPVIVIHGNQTERMPETYRRYLSNRFIKVLRLHGTPLRIQLKSGDNPFAGRRNKLTPRQKAKRERLMRNVKKRK